MNKISILTFVDLVNVGTNVKDVWVFPNREAAIQEMEKQFRKMCEKYGITDLKESGLYRECVIDTSYAYFSNEYYWDIFEKEIGIL